MMLFHPLDTDILPPERFNNPFYYDVHPLTAVAVRDILKKIRSLNLNEGKMFGVLVVRNNENAIGYLAAYSGQIEEALQNVQQADIANFFVPAVFDYLQPDGYFKTKEREISLMNKDIARLVSSEEYKNAVCLYNSVKEKAEKEIKERQDTMKAAKAVRDKQRKEGNLSADDNERMTRESQFLKAEVHRTKQHFAQLLDDAANKKEYFESTVTELKRKRKEESDKLQSWLFQQFVFRNAIGEQESLPELWNETRDIPSGAGECCEPKLLQYAFLNNYKPLCMAMFWWGQSPKSVIRQHLNFYPACNGKCKPILTWMLKGLDVDDNPLEKEDHKQLEVVYDDDSLVVVNKPEGMLSVPGKSKRESVLSILKEKYPSSTGPMIVHRLDMATSGLLVVTKNKECYTSLQQQFANHSIKKRYCAVLSYPRDFQCNDMEENAVDNGNIKQCHFNIGDEGEISLPLAPDINDRPRQTVNYEYGKDAITRYKIIGKKESKESVDVTVLLYPHTGRTHQLRVHCAHSKGLNCSIKGDELYGKKANRLHLHAEYLEFTHPKTGERVHFERKPTW